MKFNRFTIVTSFLLFVIAGCSKEKEMVTVIPPQQLPIQETKPVQGTWMGTRIGLNKSIPVHFGFIVKPEGKLEVMDPAKQVIGAGTWTFDNDVFAVKYAIYSTGLEYSAQSAFFLKPDKLGGSWGYGSDDENGGTWEMTKTN